MSIFHTHNWEVVSSDYAPGVNDWYFEDGVRFGVTHVYFKCTECGDIKQKDFTGKLDIMPKP